MAIHSVVLDPEGDILVIVPGAIPEGAQDPKVREPLFKPLFGPQPLPTPASFLEPEPEPSLEPAPLSPPLPEVEATLEEVTANEEEQPNAPETTEEEDQWRFRASSKHLALASTYVKKMLSGPWREANEVHDDGLLHWRFDGFDVDAISIILCVIHGLNRRVPRTVELSLLGQIARAVDYLDCHEVMELYASIWTDSLAPASGSGSHSSKEGWDSWISVTGVFRNDALFKKWTHVAIVNKLNCAPSLELPILSRAYEIIDQQRQLYLDQIIGYIYDQIDHLSCRKTCCDECDGMMLGTMLRHLRAHSLPALRPQRPYEKLSISDVVRAVRTLSLPTWYSKVRDEEPTTRSAFEFWGRPHNTSKKAAKLKSRKKPPLDVESWGITQPADEIDVILDVVVVEHTCGFAKTIAAVDALESEIKGLSLTDDLGIPVIE